MEIKHEGYLQQLIDNQGNNLIKIITGIHRCGKSYLLFKLFADHLLATGIAEEHIVRIDLENYRHKGDSSWLSHITLTGSLHR